MSHANTAARPCKPISAFARSVVQPPGVNCAPPAEKVFKQAIAFVPPAGQSSRSGSKQLFNHEENLVIPADSIICVLLLRCAPRTGTNRNTSGRAGRRD